MLTVQVKYDGKTEQSVQKEKTNSISKGKIYQKVE